MSRLGSSMSQEIGGIFYTVSVVGADTAVAQITQTEAAMRNLGNTTQSTATKIKAASGSAATSSGLLGFANAVKGTTAPLRSAVGAVVGTIGAFTRMLGVVGLVTTAVGGLVVGVKSLYDWLNNTPSKVEEALKGLRQFGKEIDNIKKANAAGPDDPFGALSDEATETAVKAYERLKIVTEQLKKAQESILNQLLDPGIRAYAAFRIGQLQRESDELRTQIDLINDKSKSTQRVTRETINYFNALGKGKSGQFEADRLAFTSIADQLSAIGLERSGREQ